MPGNAKIEERSQAFDPGQIVDLYELDLTEFDGSTLRFTAGVDDDGTAILYGGEIYLPLPVEANGFEYVGGGQFPRPTIRISNVANALTSLLLSFDDLLGVELKRIRTYKRFLDNGSDPDLDARLPDEIWIIERKISENKFAVEWELASSVDHEGVQLPRRTIHRNACTYTYRRFDPTLGGGGAFIFGTCPYSGAENFTVTDAPTLADSEDVCSKRLSSCLLRFGTEVDLPFQGFPGTGRVR